MTRINAHQLFQIATSMFSSDDVTSHHSPVIKKKDVRSWGSPCRFSNRNRSKSLTFRPLKLSKIKAKSPIATHDSSNGGANLRSEHSGSFAKRLFRRNHGVTSGNPDRHIVVHMQGHASPYADFTAHAVPDDPTQLPSNNRDSNPAPSDHEKLPSNDVTHTSPLIKKAELKHEADTG